MGGGGNGGYPSFYDDQAGYFKDGKDLRVDVTDLQSFAQNAQLEMQNFVANWNSAVTPLMMSTSNAFGLNGDFREAAWTRAYHGGVLDAIGQLVADAALGFQAMSTASMTIAAEYMNGDHEGAEGLDVVSEAFYPTDPNANSLDKLREQVEQQGEDGDQGGGSDQSTSTATEGPRETGNPYEDSRPYRDPHDHTMVYPNETPEDQPITVGKGDAQVIIGPDPYADAPDPETRD